MQINIELSCNNIDDLSTNTIIAMITNNLMEYQPVIRVTASQENSAKPLCLKTDEAVAFALYEIVKTGRNDNNSLYPNIFVLHSVIKYLHGHAQSAGFPEFRIRDAIEYYRDAFSSNPPFQNPALIFNSLKFIKVDNHISLNLLAQKQNITPSYLSSAIAKTNITFTDLINYTKLLSALNMFINLPVNTSLETIAYDIGYSSIHYFNKVFRKYLGITPGFARRAALIFAAEERNFAIPATI
ncbi:MAG: helix-turn-helix transcriptional regulator [bacterium]|nr:helix-turn-helix transcriptional regulator [bacterium]